MRSLFSRRAALRLGGVAGALAAITRGSGVGNAARGEPLLLGRLNLAGKSTTTLRSKAGAGGPPGSTTLQIENNNSEGGFALFAKSTGGVCIGTYGQLGGRRSVRTAMTGSP